MDSAEQAVEDYKTSNKISGLSQEAELYLQGYAEYEKQLVEVETQLSLTDYIKAFVTDSKNAYSPIPANLGIDDQSLSSMIAQYNELLLRRMEMQRSATAENPMLAKLDEQLGAMRENIVMSINSVRDGLLIMKQDAERQSRRYSSRIDDVPQQEREYLQLKRDQTLIQQVYLFLYQKREEAALTLASVVNPVKVLDAPEKMPKAVHPRKMMVLLIAIVIGGLLPFGVLLLSEMLREDLAAARRKDETDGVTSSAEGREV